MQNERVLQLADAKFEELFLCFCGYARCHPCHSSGPAVKPSYIIHFILEGKGIYKVGERKYELHAGQGFLIEPGTPIFYQADGKEPWSYVWIGFFGSKATEYLRDIGLNSEQLIFSSSYGEELKNIVLKMLENDEMTIHSQYQLESLLYEFFAALAKDIVLNDDKNSVNENTYIRQAINYIRNNYSMGIKVTDVAEYVSVSRSYLYKIFEEYLDMSPQEFLTKFRISRAKGLLKITELSIEEIAASCGYRDALVFSKAFKKNQGITPSDYRKRKHSD